MAKNSKSRKRARRTAAVKQGSYSQVAGRMGRTTLRRVLRRGKGG